MSRDGLIDRNPEVQVGADQKVIWSGKLEINFIRLN